MLLAAGDKMTSAEAVSRLRARGLRLLTEQAMAQLNERNHLHRVEFNLHLTQLKGKLHGARLRLPLIAVDDPLL
jgi:hypothetical protein